MSLDRQVARWAELVTRWPHSDEAWLLASRYQNHYLDRYLRERMAGAHERALAHPRGNARGRFYERVALDAMSHALAAQAGEGVEFACGGGSTDLSATVLERNSTLDILLPCPSFRGGPAIARAEFDALVVYPAHGTILVEVTASNGNLPDLVSDLWRKQLVAMQAFGTKAVPPVLLISPHLVASVVARVAELRVLRLPYPEHLWEYVESRSGPQAGRPPAPVESVGARLRGAAAPDFPLLMGRLAEGFLNCVRAEGDAAGFCCEHRDEFAMTRRVYLGALTEVQSRSGADRVAEFIERLPRVQRPDSSDVAEAVRAGLATVHLTLRVERYGRPLRPIIHVVTRTTGRQREYRIEPGGRAEWITDGHKAEAFRRELPPALTRPIDLFLAQEVIAACSRTTVFEPSIANAAMN